MEIILNGERESLDGELTVNELIKKFELKAEMVNVSLNGSILAKDAFDKTVVKDGDTVDILLFMGGGK